MKREIISKQDKVDEHENTLSNESMKSFIRPMFHSTISFGHATEEEVEKYLDSAFPTKKKI